MKKFLFILFGLFVIMGAFAAGENVPTSKSYVDSKLGEKQDNIIANDTPRVLTNTGTAGEYDTRGIYDATGEYAVQQNNLVDAATMNAGVQNAIDSEFQCIEWLDPNDHSSDCLLFNIFGETGKSVLPTGFTALEYIESTGTQYIDTEIQRSSSVYDLEVDVSFADSTNRYLIGTDNHSPGYCGRASDGKFELNYSLRTSMSSGVNERVKMRYYGTGTSGHTYLTVTKNGVSETLTANSSANANVTTRTFVIYANNTSSSVSRILNGKIYLAKLSLDGDLKRNFIPARRDSDGEIGMYDTVTNTFFTNAGTGEFIAGPVVNLYLPSGN